MALTPEELAEIQKQKQELFAAEQAAGAPNPEGTYAGNEQKRQEFERQRDVAKAKAEQARSRYEELKAKATPEQVQVLEQGGARSQQQAETLAIQQFGGNTQVQGQYRYSSNPIERKDQETLVNIASYYKYADSKSIQDFFVNKTIDESQLAAEDARDASALFGIPIAPKEVKGFSRSQKEMNQTGIAYAETLQAREQGFNVGSGLVYGLAPTYQKEEDKRFSERNKFIGLTENITTEKPTAKPPTRTAYTVGLTETLGGERTTQPKAYGISLTEGAPREPRKLSQAEVNKLSASEYAIYKSEYDQYNAYIKSQNEKIKVQNETIRKTNLSGWKETKQNLKGFISEAKASGAKLISINTDAGVKTVPVDDAFYEIVKSKNVKGIGVVPEIPEGYAIAGSPQELVLISEPKVIKQDREGKVTEQTGFGIQPQPSSTPGSGKDFLTLTGERATQIVMDRSKNPIERGFAAFGQVGVSTLGGLVNLQGAALQAWAEFSQNQTDPFLGNGTDARAPQNIPIVGSVQVQVPRTVPDETVGAIVGGGYTAIVEGDPLKGREKIQKGFEETVALAKKQGLLATGAQSIAYLAPFSPASVAKAVPLRYTKLVVPAAGKTGSIESLIIARELKLGYGEQMGRVGLGYGAGKVFFGLPKAESLPLQKVAYTTERGGYRITEGPSGIYMTRPQTLEQMVKIGKIRPEEAAQITRQKEGLKITEKIPDKPLRTTLTPTGKEQPQASLLPGKETSTLERIIVEGQKRLRNTMPAVKGSIINQYFSKAPRQRRDLDVDLGMTKKNITQQEATAKKEAARVAEDLNKLGGREFTAKKGSVESPTGKVIEFVTEKDSLNYQRGFKTDPDLVLGFKAPKNVVQPGGKDTYKMLPYRFQGVRKVSSILELGGDAPKPEGVSLGTSKGREKDFFDVVDYYETKASQASPEDAARLRQIAQETKDYAKSIGQWSEQKPMDFGDVTEFSDVTPDNIFKSIGTAGKKGSEFGGAGGTKELLGGQPDEDYGSGIYSKTESPSIGIKSQSSVAGKYESSSVSTKLDSKYESLGSASQDRSLEKSVGYAPSKTESPSIAGKYQGSSVCVYPRSKGSPSEKILSGSMGSPSARTESPSGSGKYAGLVGSPGSGKGGSPSTPSPGISPGTGGAPYGKSPTGKPLPLDVLNPRPTTKPLARFESKVSTAKKERREKQDKIGADFLGNSRVSDVLSFRTKETDITYGRRKIVGLVSRDVTKSGRGNFANNRSGTLLKKDKGSIRKVSKKKWAL